VVGQGGITDRAEQDCVVAAQRVERVRRHHPPVLVEERGSPWKLRPLDGQTERVHRLTRLGNHLPADAVAWKDGDPEGHTGAATAEATLST
jgi:hypothetical protein